MTSAPPEEHHRVRTSLEIATAARAAQLAIRARLMRDVTTLWPSLDARRLNETFPGWIRAMRLLVTNYHGQSAQAAAAAYRAAREAATHSPAPRSLIKLAPAPSADWMDNAFGYSGPGLLERDKVRPNTALSTTLGTATRVALEGGRTTTVDTTLADPVALGWYRITDATPCAFCALLASRGVVYKAKSFDASNTWFTGAGEFKVHDHCGCSLAPVFTRDDKLPDLTHKAREIYNNGDGDSLTLPEFRKAWNAHINAQSA